MSFFPRHQMKVSVQLHATATLALGKIKVKAKFTPDQAVKAQRGVEIKFYSFFNLGAVWGWVVNATPHPLCVRERDPVSSGDWVGFRAVLDGFIKSRLRRDSIPGSSSL